MLFLEIQCKDLMPVIRIIRDGLIPIIQIGIPIILIVLGMFDLGKAVVASKEDEIKAAQKLLVKRIVYAVAIFFVTTIVLLVFNLVNDVKGDSNVDDTTRWTKCWFETE